MAKILIVEDEDVLLNILKNKLEKEGFDVLVAVNGEEGLEVINREKPDLILLDILMPKMSGIEVLKKLKEDKTLSSIPVIILSNSGQPSEIKEAKELGVSDCLIKAEFDPQEVVDKIRKYIPEEPEESALENKINEPIPGEGTQETASQINSDNFRVLVVEDDLFLRGLMSQKLVKEGFLVIEAVDGEEGLKMVSEKQPHIVLLDLILPGIGGFEVLEKIRQDENIGGIPVLILSNLGQKDDLDKAKKLGATDYLVKAHNTPGEIVDKVKSILAQSYS
jgi:CheY-like chemotaxis protein